VYEIGKHYSLNKIFYACVIMVCFAACVIVSCEKRGKRTNEKDRILVFFGLVIIIIGKNGVSAFFVVLFVSSNSQVFKLLSHPPVLTYILFSIGRTDRYTAVSNSISSRENSTTAGKTFESSISPSAAKERKKEN
jgi:hypothetical protein